MSNKNQPVHRIRYGPVNATIWSNKSLAGCFFNTTFRRTFKNPDDTWSETDSFDDRDLPVLAKAASDAHSWIHEAKAITADEPSEEPSGDGSQQAGPPRRAGEEPNNV